MRFLVKKTSLGRRFTAASGELLLSLLSHSMITILIEVGALLHGERGTVLAFPRPEDWLSSGQKIGLTLSKNSVRPGLSANPSRD